jgi:DNA-binding beta-propeller fold protein YncE
MFTVVARFRSFRKDKRWLSIGSIGIMLLIFLYAVYGGVWAQDSPGAAEAILAFDRPTYSSPIAIDANKNLIWVVNPDDDKVTVIGNLATTPSVIKQVNVGDQPQSIAIDTDASPNSYHVFVANAAGGSVTVITVDNSSASSVTVNPQLKTITTGSEPWDIVASPDGRRVFVANSGQDTITVIRTDNQTIAGVINLRNSACNVGDLNRHFQPRGLAVTLDNSRLYVTRFLSFTKPGGVQADDAGKEGIVCLLNIPGDVAQLPTIDQAITLAPMVTGFRIDRNADGVADATSAYPNQMQSIVIRGNQAYLPNIASSPSGPLRFNVDTQAFINVIDNAAAGAPADAGPAKAINMHLGARVPEGGKTKLFFSNPWAIAFTNDSGAGNAYAVSSGSDLLVKLNVDANGVLTFTNGVSTTRYIDLNDPQDADTSGAKAGKNPLGIVIHNNKAYVMNYISRNVSVVDLTTDSVTQVIQTTPLPIAGTQDEQLQVGKEIFFSSRGVFNGGKADRLSSEGWQNCASCHFAGLTDGNIWAFAAGPRKSVPLAGTWSPHNPDDQRLLNYSAIFDEVQDFEINIRNVSGPGPASAGPPPVLRATHGLIISDTGNIDAAPAVVNAFAKPNAGRPQVTVTLPGSNTAWPALDAMKEWVRFSLRTPNGMMTAAELTSGGGVATGGLPDANVEAGRRLFFQAGCHKCHGGSKWTVSHKDFISPPVGAELATEAGAAGTVQAQFLPRFLSDISSFALGTATNPIGANVGAAEVNETGLNALGKDHNNDGKGNGFNIPSLLGIWHVPPYYHNGACETLACALTNVNHRKAGSATDLLSEPAKQAQVVAFLQSLDAATEFPLDLRVVEHDVFLDPPTVYNNTPTVLGANITLFGAKADLVNLLTDLGVNVLTVRFEATHGATVNPAEVTLDAAKFTQNFGQVVVTTTLNAPNAGRLQVKVTIDPAGQIPEDQEDNNSAARLIQVRTAPQDRTPPNQPVVFISDDTPFNDADPLTQSRDVKVKIKATDATSPSPAPTSGLSEYCIVTYTYNVVVRRWVEERCTFTPLPAPEAGANDTFIVQKQLQVRNGAAYAFVWVKDAAGNISRRPGFDVITFVPPTPIELNRNDILILRIPLPEGVSLKVTVTPDIGDVDVSVFSDFTNPNATRIALSAQNGTLPEEVTITGQAGQPNRFQIEVRAVVNSRFTIAATPAQAVGAAAAVGLTPNESQADAPPTVAGPPAQQTAIDDHVVDVYLPTVVK